MTMATNLILCGFSPYKSSEGFPSNTFSSQEIFSSSGFNHKRVSSLLQKYTKPLFIALAHFMDARVVDTPIELNATYSHDRRDPILNITIKSLWTILCTSRAANATNRL